MKKFLAFALSLVLALGLTACGGSSTKDDAPASDEASSTTDTVAKTEIVYGKSQGPYGVYDAECSGRLGWHLHCCPFGKETAAHC